jgi:EAL domain-containing protein (putative c-di-GMP-specific phosphodiesterase class I)
MPLGFRSLVATNDDDFRDELIERIVNLDLSVRTIRPSDGNETAPASYEVAWLLLDCGIGERDCLRIVADVAASPTRPCVVLLAGDEEAEFAEAVRRQATRDRVEIAAILRRPVSTRALQRVLLTSQRADLAADEVKVIPSEELVIRYQPIVLMSDRTLRRAEALVRWRHPQHGLLSPGRFIAPAERSGAIIPLTWEVLRKAVDQQVAWKRDGLLLSVAVNVSALFLASVRIADEVLALLDARDCLPNHLILEITETELARDPPAARALLQRLRDAGVEISLDDFGVGHSTLTRLRYYPFGALKIDRGLVTRVDRDQEAYRSVGELATLAAAEKLNLTGEGIETQGQWDALERLGCTYGQGHLIAHPMLGNQIRRWLNKATELGRYRPPA